MAGESARAEHERLRARRRAQRPRVLAVALGGSLLVGVVVGLLTSSVALGAVAGALGVLAFLGALVQSHREHAWRKGAEGEDAVARALDGLGGRTRFRCVRAARSP